MMQTQKIHALYARFSHDEKEKRYAPGYGEIANINIIKYNVEK